MSQVQIPRKIRKGPAPAILWLAFAAVLLSHLLLLTACDAGSDPVAAADKDRKAQSETAGVLRYEKESLPAITLPRGTNIFIRMLQSLHSSTASPGEEFQAEIAAPVDTAGMVVFPSGTRVKGRVIDAHPSGRLKDPGYLRLTLDSIQAPGGQWISVHTSAISAARFATLGFGF
jgi:hypothetical protein